MSLVRHRDNRTGVTYVYESESYWDKEKKQPRARRKLIGKIDEETGEIVPTGGKRKKKETGETAVQAAAESGSAPVMEDAEAMGKTEEKTEDILARGLQSALRSGAEPVVFGQLLSGERALEEDKSREENKTLKMGGGEAAAAKTKEQGAEPLKPAEETEDLNAQLLEKERQLGLANERLREKEQLIETLREKLRDTEEKARRYDALLPKLQQIKARYFS